MKGLGVVIVSPGFEPRQRESKSLVLPLHHETTQQAQPAWAVRRYLYHRARQLASLKYVLHPPHHACPKDLGHEDLRLTIYD